MTKLWERKWICVGRYDFFGGGENCPFGQILITVLPLSRTHGYRTNRTARIRCSPVADGFCRSLSWITYHCFPMGALLGGPFRRTKTCLWRGECDELRNRLREKLWYYLRHEILVSIIETVKLWNCEL